MVYYEIMRTEIVFPKGDFGLSLCKCWDSIHSDSENHVPMYSFLKQLDRNSPSFFTYLEQAFVMTFYVRDISHGLGKRALFYDLIVQWYRVYPLMASSILSIALESYKPFPYGSFRDIFGLLNYLKYECGFHETHDFVVDICNYLYRAFRKECMFFRNHKKTDTPLMKWMPHEKSRGGWIFALMAHKYCNMYDEFGSFSSFDVSDGNKRAFRKVVSRLRGSMDLVETIITEDNNVSYSFNQLCNPKYMTRYAKRFLQTQSFDSDPYFRYFLMKHLHARCDQKFSTQYTFQRIYDMPYVFSQCSGKLVKRGLENIHQTTDVLYETSMLLHLLWKSHVQSWIRKYQNHEYDVLLAFDEPLCCQSSCMSLAIAMLLSETNGKYCFYFNNGFALEKVDYGDKPTFIERLQCIVTILKPLIMPCVFADRASCWDLVKSSDEVNVEKSIMVFKGKCSMESSRRFVGQSGDGEYKNESHVYGAVLGHKRYDYVRKRLAFFLRN